MRKLDSVHDFVDEHLSAPDDIAMISWSPFAAIDSERATQIYHKIVTKGKLTDRKLVGVVFARE